MRAPVLAMVAVALATPAVAAEPPTADAPDGGAGNAREAIDREAAGRLSRKALARIKEGGWDDAADLLRRAHAKDPESAAIATDLGFTLAHLGRADEAERMYRIAIAQDPGRFYAYVNLAELWAADPMRWQRRDETVAFLEKALATLTDDARAHAHVELRLAELLRSLGRASDARKRLQELTGATVPAQVRRRALALMNEVDAEAHARALEDWPAPEIPAADRERLEKAQASDDRAALGVLDGLVARWPAWTQARWQRAQVLERLGQLDEAGAELTVVVQLSPSHARAWRRLGIILAEHGGGFEAERADEALRHALALEPSWSDLRELRRQVAAKRARGARKSAGERVAEPTAKARQLFQDAQSWMGMEAPEMAPPLLRQALAESPGFVEAAAALFAVEHAVPEPTVKALWNDGPGLWQLAVAVGALRSHDAAAVAAPWIDRAVELGVEEARFGRASLRAAAGARQAALSDLRDYVAAEAAPPRLEEARALRMTLVEGAANGSPERVVHLQLADDRPSDAITALGGVCRSGLPFDNLLALGKAHEFAGDPKAALGCYRQALEGRPTPTAEAQLRAWERVAGAASTLSPGEIAAFETHLQSAAQAKVALADYSLARLAETRRQWTEAGTHARTFVERADRDDPRLPEARALQARTGRVLEQEAEARSLRTERLQIGVALLLTALLSALALRRWRHPGLARALRTQPLLFPALVKSIGRARHDVLKHRTSALDLLDDPHTPRQEIARALLEPAPTSSELASIYDQLSQEARALGVQLCPLVREPVLGPLFADLQKAEALIQTTDDATPRLRAIDERLRGLHLDRLQDLLRSGPRTTLSAGLLSQWIDGVCGQRPGLTPGLHLQGAPILFPLPKPTLAAIVSNLLRNAVAASAGQTGAAVEVRAERSRDAMGRRTVVLRVADASPDALDAESIERRPADRGLGIVRDTTRAWGGELVVRDEVSPFCKSVGVRFPAPPEPSP